MFTPKASSEQKWEKKTQEGETGDVVTVHRTTMECTQKQLFATRNIVVQFQHRTTMECGQLYGNRPVSLQKPPIFSIFNPNST